jgi:hypothetical protein
MDSAGIGFPYCEAMAATGLGVRIMPIGVMHFGIEPWNRVSHLFLTSLKTRFINVVCIEPGVPLGNPISTGQFSGKANEEAAYEPPNAITGLFTVGEKRQVSWLQRVWHAIRGGSGKAATSIPNVAILSGDILPEGKELEALKHYNVVICPTKEGSDALATVGLKTMVIGPDSDQLSRLFSGMMPA